MPPNLFGGAVTYYQRVLDHMALHVKSRLQIKHACASFLGIVVSSALGSAYDRRWVEVDEFYIKDADLTPTLVLESRKMRYSSILPFCRMEPGRSNFLAAKERRAGSPGGAGRGTSRAGGKKSDEELAGFRKSSPSAPGIYLAPPL